MGYLGESSRRWYYGTKKHSYEITALYLARNPNRSEEKQLKSLRFADSAKNEEAFKLILNSRDWTSESLKSSLNQTHNSNIAKLILDKCGGTLSNEDAEEILNSHCYKYNESDYPIIKLLTSKYPEMDIHRVGQALSRLAPYRNTFRNTFKAIDFLLTHFPAISKEDRKEALLAASKKQNTETIKSIEQKTPGLVEENLDQVLKNATTNKSVSALYAIHDPSFFNWLLANYKEKITPEQIGGGGS